MYNRIFTKSNFMDRCKSIALALLFLIAGVINVSAEININTISASPSGYTPGSTTSIEFTVDFSTPDFEYADFIAFNMPATWTAVLTPGAPNPTDDGGCDIITSSGEGTNQIVFGLGDPMGNPTGGSGCGVFIGGSYTFYLDVTVPAGETGNQDVAVEIYGDGFGSNPSLFQSQNLSLGVIACAITCPSDVIVNVDPGTCGAMVTIPLPTVVGSCMPAPTDMSGFYPVGTTEVTFEADNSSPTGAVSCTIQVTVMDNEGPTLTIPSNQTLSLDGGECGAIYNYVVDASDACGDMPIVFTQSTDPVNITSSFACPGGANSYYRVFDLAALGINTNVEITDIEIGVFQSFNMPSVSVRIHELVGALSINNLELISENTLNLPDLFIELTNFPISATLEAGKTYVVEVETPGTVFNGFVMGTNFSGESGTSYLSSNFCGINDITSMTDAGGPGQNLVMSMLGSQAALTVEQTEGLESGSEFPIGVTTNTFVVTDAAGNTTELSFDITVNEFADPITTLACNNLVNISMDGNCEALITPDMVLEGGPYGCYDTYTITIKDSDGNEYGNMITADMVGLELIVEVQDPNDNICWGDIFIEDKLGPQLECGTRNTQCTQSTEPGAALASTIRLTAEPNASIDANAPSTQDIPFEVSGLDGAIITDLNVDVDISHSWVSDLGIVLVSPEGTEATLAIQPGGAVGCGENNLFVTFDDEAALTNVDLDNTCTDEDPAISGDFQPASPLSIFDGEDPNGTWYLRVNDFAFGDGGVVRSFTLEVSQSGGIVGLPIPEDATFSPLGNQSFYVFGLDPCGPTILSYTDDVNDMDCTSPYTQVIYRTYTATDESGNEAMSCVDTINVERTDLGSLELPRDYDDLDLPSLSCTSGYPTPATTGSPTGSFCENVQMDYEDITIDICEGSYKVLRYWTIFEWCESEVVEYTQIIKVVDKEGPSITCPVIDGPISTSPSSCDASLFIPVPTISDNCTAIPTYTVEASSGTLVTQGQNYSLIDLEIGTHTVTYTATDNCGNSSTCSFDFEVVDDISPVAVCDQHTTVSLSFDEQVYVDAETFDDGSYDECSDITWSARRMTDACNVAGNTSYSSTVTFCCADVGTTVMVEFRVVDESGNSNTCMVEVEVDDKIAPAIQVPDNVTLNCQDDYTDLNLTGGMAQGFDNCEIDEITFTDFPAIGSCGSGQVTRQWTVTDKSGLTASGTQFIFLQDNDPFDINDINFPSDVTLTSCEASTDPSATGEPIISDDICSQVSYTFWDDKFVIVDEACEQIYRKWTVIDQCQYNANTGQGIWEDVQVIEIINNTAPTFVTACTNQTFDVFGNCEGEVSLSVEASDDCTPEDKLVYTWKIDAFNTNDGVFEFENTGSSLTSVFPVGTHRIVWTVSDRCGNIETCDYLFTVRDAKAPTPYCISSLSTAVMNTNGEVTIWASDFDLGATDNCTPPELLIPSFTENGITSSLTFTCDDIPNGIAAVIDDIQIWVTDEAGNKDFCTVSLLVEDNEADFCEDMGTVTASGAIYTPNDEKVEEVVLEATNGIEDVLTSELDEQGNYSFDFIPNFDYEITAEKNINFINGVTTLDIVLIQKHILGLQVFDSPYKTIAADTDNNGQISGADIIAIRRLILGFTDDFPNEQQSWRFVDQNANFDNVYEVFPYDEILDVNFNTGANLINDFIGVKIGDVNQTASPATFASNVDTRSDKTLNLVMDNSSLRAGEVIEIPVFADEFNNMLAYQMTVEFDLTKLMIKDIRAGALNITDQHMNMTRLNEGLFSTIWNSSEPVSTDEALFYLIVEAKRDTDISEVFRTSNRITETVAYDANYQDSDIQIQWRDREGVMTQTDQFVLYQNTPNPFATTTNIAFDLPQSSQVELTIFNMNGVLVKTIQQGFAKGYNSIEINKDDLQASGVYYYTIRAGEHTSNGKMILID